MKLNAVFAACAATLIGCGGGANLTTDEAWEIGAVAEMDAACRDRGSFGVLRWRFVTSHYPTGPMAGEVFARGWEAWCFPTSNGEQWYIPRLPPVI